MTPRQRTERRWGLALLAPAVLTLAALTLYPALWVLWLSLHERVPVFGVHRFTGLTHYRFLTTDPRFWNAAGVTAAFTLASVGLELVLGLLAALALCSQRWGHRAGLTLLLLAWALPSVVAAKLFEWLYHPTGGLVNVLLGGRTVNWLGEPGLALAGLIVADVWRAMPFVALLCYARLLTIPAELYEAARVDGAGGLALFRRITLPLLRQILLVALAFRTMDALRAFDLMFVLTGGGPAGTTETLTVYAYRTMFQTLQLGLGAAVGVVVFAVVMSAAWAYLALLRRGGLVG